MYIIRYLEEIKSQAWKKEGVSFKSQIQLYYMLGFTEQLILRMIILMMLFTDTIKTSCG